MVVLAIPLDAFKKRFFSPLCFFKWSIESVEEHTSFFSTMHSERNKAFYVVLFCGGFFGLVWFLVLGFFLWKGNNEEELSVCMSSLEWSMKNMLSVMEAAGNW